MFSIYTWNVFSTEISALWWVDAAVRWMDSSCEDNKVKIGTRVHKWDWKLSTLKNRLTSIKLRFSEVLLIQFYCLYIEQHSLHSRTISIHFLRCLQWKNCIKSRFPFEKISTFEDKMDSLHHRSCFVTFQFIQFCSSTVNRNWFLINHDLNFNSIKISVFDEFDNWIMEKFGFTVHSSVILIHRRGAKW